MRLLDFGFLGPLLNTTKSKVQYIKYYELIILHVYRKAKKEEDEPMQLKTGCILLQNST